MLIPDMADLLWGFTNTSGPYWFAMGYGASLMLGEDISAADPILTIPTLGDRPVLFLHGTADPYDLPQRSVELNLQAARDAGVPAEVHYCEGAGHAAVVDRCRVEWGAWVRAFLASALAGDPARIGVASIS